MRKLKLLAEPKENYVFASAPISFLSFSFGEKRDLGKILFSFIGPQAEREREKEKER